LHGRERSRKQEAGTGIKNIHIYTYQNVKITINLLIPTVTTIARPAKII